MAVAFCCIPDFLWALPRVAKVLMHNGRMRFTDINDHTTRFLYRTNHSIITAIFASLIGYIAANSEIGIGIAAGWLLHILMDIWTHKGGIVDGIRPFYPLSGWKFPAIIWWKEELARRKWIYIINLAAATAAYCLI
jgi:membrane-bound metal-dependent hydrolase YbcI (DUF457 family)